MIRVLNVFILSAAEIVLVWKVWCNAVSWWRHDLETCSALLSLCAGIHRNQYISFRELDNNLKWYEMSADFTGLLYISTQWQIIYSDNKTYVWHQSIKSREYVLFSDNNMLQVKLVLSSFTGMFLEPVSSQRSVVERWMGAQRTIRESLRYYWAACNKL